MAPSREGRSGRAHREVGDNAAMALHVIKEGGLDKRHLPLIDAIISQDNMKKPGLVGKFIEKRYHETGGPVRMTLLPGASHYLEAIKALRNNALIDSLPEVYVAKEFAKTENAGEKIHWDECFKPAYKDPIAVDVLRHIRRLLISKK